jgi:hypothetical protein
MFGQNITFEFIQDDSGGNVTVWQEIVRVIVRKQFVRPRVVLYMVAELELFEAQGLTSFTFLFLGLDEERNLLKEGR